MQQEILNADADFGSTPTLYNQAVGGQLRLGNEDEPRGRPKDEGGPGAGAGTSR
jgi:hypothetical protein